MKRDIDVLSGNTRIGILELLLVVKGKDHPLPGPLRPPEELEAPSQVDTIVTSEILHFNTYDIYQEAESLQMYN